MPSRPSSLRAWLVVALLFFVGLLDYLDRLMPITMRLSLKQAVPMTDAQFGLLTTAFFFVYAALVPLGGYAADTFGSSRLIVISLFIWSAVTWLTAHAASFGGLLLARALLGAAEATYLPAAGALIGKYHRNATLSLAMGIHLSGVMLGAVLSGTGGWLAERHGWRFPFELFGLAGVGYSLVLLVLLRDPKAGENAEAEAGQEMAPAPGLGETLRHLFGRRNFLLVLVLYTLMGVASWVFLGWLPSFVGEHFKLAEGKSGLIATGFTNWGALVGYLVGGVWADRWSRTRAPARAWVAVIGLILSLPCVLLVAKTNTLAAAAGGLLLFGLSRALADTNMVPILFHFIDRRYRATALGFFYACGTTAGGILIYLGGVLRDAHIDIVQMFYAGMVATVLAAALLWAIRPRDGLA